MPKISEAARQLARANLAAISDEEDAAITAAAMDDPDAAPLDDEFFAKARRYRPRAQPPKKSVALRIDPEVLEAWRATGAGWQTRMGEVLRRAVGK